MPAGRVRTWLDPSVEGSVFNFRCFSLAPAADCLHHMFGAAYVKNVQTLHAEVSRLRSASALLELVGTTSILFKQMHAHRGQALVGATARRLHRSGSK
jgi:hypothetical protein